VTETVASAEIFYVHILSLTNATSFWFAAKFSARCRVVSCEGLGFNRTVLWYEPLE
jgi:hypothetical protein